MLNKPTQTSINPPGFSELETAEAEISEFLNSIRKVKEKISRTRMEAGKSKPINRLKSLAKELRAIGALPSPPDLSRIASSLERKAAQLTESLLNDLRGELRTLCEKKGIGFKPSGEAYTIGPFALSIDLESETSSLRYATLIVENDIPLDADAIVNVTKTTSDLIHAPLDTAFPSELEESIRVAIARHGRHDSRNSSSRAELPGVFREMQAIREWKSSGKKQPKYTLARFVYELGRFIQSEANNRGAKRFRLETAVIENTKNPKKSIFIPKDFSSGSGEGSYFQAIEIVNQG